MGNHSPQPSSVANCVAPFINKMADNGFDIDVVTDRKDVNFPKFERINNVNIYRVDDYRTMNTTNLNEIQQIESTRLLKFFTKLFSLTLKVLYYTTYCLLATEKQTG